MGEVKQEYNASKYLQYGKSVVNGSVRGKAISSDVFTPHPWQIAPLNYKGPVMLLSGSAGGGKSRLIAEKIFGFAVKYPGATCLVLRKKEGDNENSTLALFERLVFPALLRDKRIIRTSKKMRYDLWNGSAIIWGGMYGEDQRENLRSIGMLGGIDMVWMEEATQFEESDFDEIIARIRGKAADWTQLILSTNPDGPFHWINTRLIRGGEAKVFLSSASDNPSNPPDYLNNLNRMRGVSRLRLVEGIWARAANIVLDGWSDYGDLGTPDMTQNVTEEADYIPGGGDVVWFVDDGYSGEYDADTGTFKAKSHPRCFLLAQIRSSGQVAVFAESYAVKTHDHAHINAVIAMCMENGWAIPSRVVYDKAAPSLGGSLRDRLGMYGLSASSVVYNAVPVNDGNKEVNARLAEDENGVRMIIVHPRCKILRSEIATYSRGQSGAIIKDFDHGPDALRLGIWDMVHGPERFEEDVASSWGGGPAPDIPGSIVNVRFGDESVAALV